MEDLSVTLLLLNNIYLLKLKKKTTGLECMFNLLFKTPTQTPLSIGQPQPQLLWAFWGMNQRIEILLLSLK